MVAPVVVVVVPVVPVVASTVRCFRGSKRSWRRQHEGHKDCRKLVFHNFSFIHRHEEELTLKIRIVYFEYNILVKSPFLSYRLHYIQRVRKARRGKYKIVNDSSGNTTCEHKINLRKIQIKDKKIVKKAINYCW